MACVAVLLGVGLLAPAGRAPPVYPTVTIWIHRVQPLDPFDNTTFPELYYWVGISEQGQWEWRTDTVGSGPDLIVDDNVSFPVQEGQIGIAILLCDGDTSSPDDAADLSARPGGGADDIPGRPCTVSTSAAPDHAYQGNWSIVSGSLSGDNVTQDGDLWITTGEGDGSTGSTIDENDAAVWFGVTDDYDPPTAEAGPGTSILPGESVVLNASASHGSDGSSLQEFTWDLDDDGTVDRTGVSITANFTTPGNHTVRLRVVDSLGVVATDTTYVNVAGRPTVSDTAWVWILIGLLALLSLLLFLWFRRRSRSREEAAPVGPDPDAPQVPGSE